MQRAAIAALALLATGVLACGSKSETRDAAPSAPAHVENPKNEADLTTVSLVPEAEARLGIRTAPVEYRAVHRTRTFGGEVMIPAGTFSGEAGRPPMALRSPASAAERAQAGEALRAVEGEMSRGRVQVEATTIALQRAQRMLRDGIGSKRAVDEATAALRLAEATLIDAENRRDVLARETSHVPDVVWIRVPVFVDQLHEIAVRNEARIGSLAGTPGEATRSARPVSAPPSANADAATIDVFYVLQNQDGAVLPGQRVGVTVDLRGEQQSRVVPWSAVLHDIHGGEWVYERVAPHRFARRRVQVRHVTDGAAVLASGPAPGAEVVVAGAAELFGTEFGVGK